MIRWQATVTYRYEDGPRKVICDLEELDELAPLVEPGPHWDTIISPIIIDRVGYTTNPTLTVEQSAKT